MSLDSMVKKVASFRPIQDQPVGKAFVYSAGFGVSAGVTGLVQRVTGLDSRIASIINAVLLKTRMVQGKIGSETAEMLATAAWIYALTSMYDIAGAFAMPIQAVAGGAVAPVTSDSAMKVAAEPASNGGLSSMLYNLPIIGPILFGASTVAGMVGGESAPAKVSGLGAIAPLRLTSVESKLVGIR